MAHRRGGHTVVFGDDREAFLPCAYEVMAKGHLFQECGNVGFLHNVQVLVGSITAEAAYGSSGVEDADALLAKQCLYFF